MASADVVQVIIVSSICVLIIALRTIYRLTFRCKVHSRCHRKWHSDDVWMTFSLIPLLGRSLCIAWSNELISESENERLLGSQRLDAKMDANKLLIPGRIFYMFFLWCMKMCLLALYMRLSEGLPVYQKIGTAIRWSLYLTFVGVVLSTVLECRPLELAWNADPAGVICRKARANLITMAVCNISTDIALILFPISILRRSGLDFMRFFRLAFLFGLGSLVIITTIIRLPLILRDDAQKTRSLWASIEIACACFIANAPFFQAAYIDSRLRKNHNSIITHSSSDNNNSSITHSRSIALKGVEGRGSEGISGLDEEEVGFWHIEKRVSFYVEGRKNSMVGSMGSEGARSEVTDARGSERAHGSRTVVSLGEGDARSSS